MKGLVLGQKRDFESAETFPRVEVTWVSISVTRHEMVTDDQPIRICRNIPAFKSDSIERREEYIFVQCRILPAA